MITNTELTIYHKGFDITSRLEKWTRHNYDKVWYFNTKSASINDGYTNSNTIQIRIPYKQNNININDLAIGDILVKGKVLIEIEKQEDLSNYEVHNITSINNNNFGTEPHIHIGGQ